MESKDTVTGIYLIEKNWEGRGNIEAITWRDRDNSQKNVNSVVFRSRIESGTSRIHAGRVTALCIFSVSRCLGSSNSVQKLSSNLWETNYISFHKTKQRWPVNEILFGVSRLRNTVL